MPRVYSRQQLENRRLTCVLCVCVCMCALMCTHVLYAHTCSRDRRGLVQTFRARRHLRDPWAQPTHFTDEEIQTHKVYVTSLRAYSY